MKIHGANVAANPYGMGARLPVCRPTLPGTAASAADRVSISDAARALLAKSDASPGAGDIDSRLAAIKAKPAVQRTEADTAYLLAHDDRYAAIQEKTRKGGIESLSADDIDYMQKAAGFVNTMASLSPNEKALYDELSAAGNRDVAEALLLVGLSRTGMSGQEVTLPNGTRVDPTRTEITAANLRNLFKYTFVDASGSTDRKFEALAAYLDQRAS